MLVQWERIEIIYRKVSSGAYNILKDAVDISISERKSKDEHNIGLG